MTLPCVAELEENGEFIQSHPTKDAITLRTASLSGPRTRNKHKKPALTELQRELLFEAAEILDSDQDDNGAYHCSQCEELLPEEVVLPHLFVIHHLHERSPPCLSCRNFIRDICGQPMFSPSSQPLLSPSNPYVSLHSRSHPRGSSQGAPQMERHPVDYPRDEDQHSNGGNGEEEETNQEHRHHTPALMDSPPARGEEDEDEPEQDRGQDPYIKVEEDESDEEDSVDKFRNRSYSTVTTAPASPADQAVVREQVVTIAAPIHNPPLPRVEQRPPVRRIYRTRAAVREGRRSPAILLTSW